ncbi:MAG: site-specific integrase [Alphaproteobacteria bacterium]|nr:site-specific integrase [Alphaproteobacteria bacterium]
MSKTAVPETLADAIECISRADDLTPTRQRDLISAVRRIAGILDRPAEQLPARLVDLKQGLNGVHPEQLNPPISPKTWANLRSNLVAALRAAGANERKPRKPLTSPWKELAGLLRDKRLRDGLSRLIRHLAEAGISPADVSDATIDLFMTATENHTLLDQRQLHDLHRRSTRLWNEAVALVPAWPRNYLTVPSFKRPRQTVNFEELPRGLQSEIAAYLDWRLGNDPFNAPPRISRPISVRQVRSTLLLAISAYLRRGGTLAELGSLRDVVEPERVKLMLLEYWIPGDGKGAKGKARPTAHSIAQVLFAVASVYLELDAQHLDTLRAIKRQLGSQPGGMTAKNRATLRAFEDDRNKWLLLSLPAKLWAEAIGNEGEPERRAIRAQLAIAIEILLVAPMRSINLFQLRRGHTLLKPAITRGSWHVVLEEDDTKSAEPLEYELPARVTTMIDEYWAELRRTLIRGNTDEEYLFPSRSGGCKSQQTLAQQIRQIIAKRTGLHLSPHQFRHLAAQFLLDDEPGNHIGVSDLLGHRNPKSSRMYSGLRTKPAGRHHERLLTEQRSRLAEQAAKKPRRRSRPLDEPKGPVGAARKVRRK